MNGGISHPHCWLLSSLGLVILLPTPSSTIHTYRFNFQFPLRQASSPSQRLGVSKLDPKQTSEHLCFLTGKMGVVELSVRFWLTLASGSLRLGRVRAGEAQPGCGASGKASWRRKDRCSGSMQTQAEKPQGLQGQEGDTCKHSCTCIHSTNIYRVPTTRTDAGDTVVTKIDEILTLSKPQW